MRRGGHVVLSVPEDPDRFGPSDVQVGHFRRYTEESLSEVLTGAGLEVTKVQHYGWPLGYLLEAVSHRAAKRALAGGDEAPADPGGGIRQLAATRGDRRRAAAARHDPVRGGAGPAHGQGHRPDRRRPPAALRSHGAQASRERTTRSDSRASEPMVSPVTTSSTVLAGK